MAPISQAPLYKAIGDLGTAKSPHLPWVVGDDEVRATSSADDACDSQSASPPLTLLTASRELAGLFDSEAVSASLPLDISALPEGSILLNVYNNGEADPCEQFNLACSLNDTVHAGVEVYGSEWSYAFTEDERTGVYPAVPRNSSKHTYRVTVNMGSTRLSACEVEASLHNLERRWRGPDYNQRHHSCLDFCNAFCSELGVGRIPGWVDRFGCTSSFDILSRCTADSIRTTTELARSVSNDFDFHVRNVSQNLAQEVEQAVAGARREVEAISVSFMRWGQGLLGAAARALGDLEQGRRHGATIGGEALRNSLRNRGGIRLAARKALTAPATKDEAVDAFLLDDSLESPNASKDVRKQAIEEPAVVMEELRSHSEMASETSSQVETEESWTFPNAVEATFPVDFSKPPCTASTADSRANRSEVVDAVYELISDDDLQVVSESIEDLPPVPDVRGLTVDTVEALVTVSPHFADTLIDFNDGTLHGDMQAVEREGSDNEWTLL